MLVSNYDVKGSVLSKLEAKDCKMLNGSQCFTLTKASATRPDGTPPSPTPSRPPEGGSVQVHPLQISRHSGEVGSRVNAIVARRS